MWPPGTLRVARSLVLIAAGCEVSPWGKRVDRDLASAAARGDFTAAGAAFAEYALAGDRARWLRRLLGPATGKMLSEQRVPPNDYLIEQRAEDRFDARRALRNIQIPVLFLCGDRDRFFTRDVITETARLVSDSTIVWYEGQGHLKATTNKRIPHDLLAF